MKRKKIIKRIFITISIILIVIIGLITYFVIKDLREESTLKKEIVNYSNKNLEKDDFPINIKTNGDYAYIEEAIKKYYQQLSNNIKDISSYLNNKQLINILSIDNLTNDKPYFTISQSTIQKTKEKISKAINNINSLCSENTIENLIDKDKLSDQKYYYDLYKELMYTKNDLQELKKVREEMNNLSKKLNTYLDKINQVLLFLKENDEYIEYSDKLYFHSEDLLIEYKKMISDLDIIANTDDKNNSNNQEQTKNTI